uniref:Uncharacterized protein n=1 Tax=Lepeophtheirus salmonis TaxID=72036 RepID=A0A0K2UW19_LEPSM
MDVAVILANLLVDILSLLQNILQIIKVNMWIIVFFFLTCPFDNGFSSLVIRHEIIRYYYSCETFV